MKLPPELEFHEDLHLLMYRPHGVIDEAAVKKVVDVLEDLEAKLQEPFNRFTDTSGADEIELNFKYVIQVLSASTPFLCGSSTGEVSDSSYRFDDDSLRAVACCADSRFADQCSHLQRSKGSGRLARRTDRTISGANMNSERLLNSEAVLAVPQVTAVAQSR